MNHTILVVDDSPDIAELVADALNQEPQYKATDVGDVARALEIVQRLKVDLFILDFFMPRMNGIELYDRLQLIPSARGVPVLFMTTDPAIFRRLRNRDFPVLCKPFDLEDLLYQVATLLGDA
jgi:CheY-like chemotaxis protein